MNPQLRALSQQWAAQYGSIFSSILMILAIGAATAARSQDKTITVFGAASLTNALNDVDTVFTKQSTIKVVTDYDASSALIMQIEHGAVADVFASADLKWMDYGVEKKLINESTQVNLLGNKLVLIAPKSSKINHVNIVPRAENGNDGKCSRRTGLSRPPYSTARHRLFY